MALITYEFDYLYGEAWCSFLVDTEKFTDKHANATLEFYDWFYDKDADPIDEVMKKYALRAIKFATYNGHNSQGVMSDFSETEGYGKVDGTTGVTLLGVAEYEFIESELEVTKNKK